VLAIVDGAFVLDPADVDRVAEHREQHAALEGNAADGAVTDAALLRAVAIGPQLLDQRSPAAELGIAGEDVAHGDGVGFIDEQLALMDAVAERHGTTHPHALLLGRGDLVTDALARDLTLELGEAEQYVEREAAHAGGGVERLRHRYEAGTPGIEHVNDLGEVGERAGEPVDLVDDDDVDLAGGDVGQQPLEAGPVHVAAREAAIVLTHLDLRPAFVALAEDVGGTGLGLRI
jgi:hypothetical protein